MAGASFTLSLIDKISGASKSISAALSDNVGALHKVESASRNVDAAIGKTGAGMNQVQAASGGAVSGSSALESALGGLSGVATAGAAAVALVGAALGAAAIEGGMFAAKMAMFKQDTLFGLSIVLGSGKEADRILQESVEISRLIGGRPAEVATSMRGLLKAGFGEQDAKELVMAFADLQAIDPSANIAGITTQLSQMKGIGKASMEDLKPIAAAGVSFDKIFAHIAQNKGLKAPADAAKAISAGKVSALEASDAIKQAIAEMGGNKPLRSVSKAFAETTTTGQIKAVTGAVDRLFAAIDTGNASDAAGKALRKVRSLLDPDTAGGKKLLVLLNQAAEGAARVIDFVANPGAIGKAFDVMSDSLGVIVPLLGELGGGFLDGLGGAFEVVGKALGDVGIDASKFNGVGPVLRTVGEAIGYVVVGASLLVAGIAAVGAAVPLIIPAIGVALTGALAFVAMKLTELGNTGLGLGSNLVDGITNGIKGGIGAAIAAVEGLANMLPASVRKILGIHSPSKVFADLGGFTVQGMAQGIDAKAPTLHERLADLVQAPTLIAPRVSVGNDVGGNAGQHGATSMGAPQVTINITGGASADPHELADEMRRAIDRWWVEVAASSAGLAALPSPPHRTGSGAGALFSWRAGRLPSRSQTECGASPRPSRSSPR